MNNVSYIYTTEHSSISVLNSISNLSKTSAAPSSPTTATTTTTTYRPWDFGEIGLLIMLIFGTVGNCLSISVMRNKRMRNTNAALFVTCMATSDTILLLAKFIGNMIKLYRVSIYNLCILIQVVPQAASFISVWLIIITSAERMIAVLRPLKVGIIFSKKRCQSIIILMILFFFALSSSLSICISYSIQQPYYCQIKGSQNGTCFQYYTYVFPWIKSSLGSWMPSILGICFNLVIICELYRASRERETITNAKSKINNSNHNHNHNGVSSNLLQVQSNLVSTKSRSNLDLSKQNGGGGGGGHKKEKQITIMLLTISISFIVFTLPYSTYELLRKLGVKFTWLKNRNVMRACMLLMDLNHSTNFIFYCLTAQKFRTALVENFCGNANNNNKNNKNKKNNQFNNPNNNNNNLRKNNNNTMSTATSGVVNNKRYHQLANNNNKEMTVQVASDKTFQKSSSNHRKQPLK